jgi:hypothetical protein
MLLCDAIIQGKGAVGWVTPMMSFVALNSNCDRRMHRSPSRNWNLQRATARGREKLSAGVLAFRKNVLQGCHLQQ